MNPRAFRELMNEPSDLIRGQRHRGLAGLFPTKHVNTTGNDRYRSSRQLESGGGNVMHCHKALPRSLIMANHGKQRRPEIENLLRRVGMEGALPGTNPKPANHFAEYPEP